MCRGYHRRDTARMHRTRILAAAIYNAQRGPDDEAVQPEDIFWLPGDDAPAVVAELTDEEYQAALARAAELDADLL